MDLGIQGKVALVTGGSRGLGKVAALSLAREGVNVAICGRTQSTLDGTVAELEALGVRAQGVVADVTDVDAMPPLAQAVVDGLGPSTSSSTTPAAPAPARTSPTSPSKTSRRPSTSTSSAAFS